MPASRSAATFSWSATLRLPKSRFPPRPILADRPKYLKQSCDDLYAWQGNASSPAANVFVLHDGPPYANGDLHVGHALNKILKDVTCRTRLLDGRRVNYVPGWDCHGLPIELKALQKNDLGSTLSSPKLSPSVVRTLAKTLAEDTIQKQKAGFREWAVMGDWDNAWKTLDKPYELAQLQVFGRMLGEGLIYQREKPVYWSPSSKTALAEAELEYNPEHTSTAAFVKFPLASFPTSLKGIAKNSHRVSVVVWTTTPWTLVANRSIAVHRDLEYCCVNSPTHGILLVARSRLEELAKACNEELISNVMHVIPGNDLIGATYENPLLAVQPSDLRIVHADFVSADSGTGIVHMAPGHGMEDYKICQTMGIHPFAPVDDAGQFTKEALVHEPERLQGKVVTDEGNQAVLALARVAGMLIRSHTYQHSYPYDWRSKKPVIIRATKQWFADLEDIRKSAVQSLEDVKFIPERGKGRLASFLQGRTEWCISRQRPWGVPIPVLYEQNSHDALMTPESVDHIVKVMRERGSEAWWTDDPFDPAWVPTALRNTTTYSRGKDTMDVWFDSGTSWTQMPFPQADVYIEGTDQHRGWFQSSLLTRIANGLASRSHSGLQAPYKTLITHGFTLDQAGRKMSKSIGNVISPKDIMEGTLLPQMTKKSRKGSKDISPSVTYDALGPDALRMWVAASDYSRDIVISQPVLQAVQNSVTKLRVTFKLLLGFLDTYQPHFCSSFAEMEFNNQLALLDSQSLVQTVRASYEEFQYHRAITSINAYIADLSSGYIETVKDRIYTDATHSETRTQAQAVIWQLFQRLCDVLSPITPVLVEEAISYLPPQLTYHPIRDTWERWPRQHDSCITGEWRNDEIHRLRPLLNGIKEAVKALQEDARSVGQMGSSLGCDVEIRLDLDSWSGQRLLTHRQAVEDMLVVSRLSVLNMSAEMAREGIWAYDRLMNLDSNDGEVQLHVTVRQPENLKCVRCWKFTVTPSHELEDTLCNRCVGVLEGLRADMPMLFDEKPKLNEAALGCRHCTDQNAQKQWGLVQ